MTMVVTSPVTEPDRPYATPWNSCQSPATTSARPMARAMKPFQVMIGRSTCALLISRMRSILSSLDDAQADGRWAIWK